MATILVNGQQLTVDDSFLSLSPDDQNFLVDELSRRLPPPVDSLPPPVDKSHIGQLWPISRDADGNRYFDSDAGILGALKRSVMLPGDVYSGKVQMNGPDGRISPEAIGRSLEFASTFIPASPGLRAGEGLVPGLSKSLRRPNSVEPPSSNALYAEAERNFEAMRNSGVDYSSDAVKTMAEAVQSKLEKEGFDPELAGKTHKILAKLFNPPENSLASIEGLDSARKTFGKIAQYVKEPNDQAAASRVIRELDEFIGAGDPATVVAGKATDAADALKAASGNFAAAKRSDIVNGIDRSPDFRAVPNTSATNTVDVIRQRAASTLLQDKEIFRFSPEEIEALKTIAGGSAAQNVTRRIGKFLEGGSGLARMLSTAAGGAAGAAASSTGGAGAAASGAAVGALVPTVLGQGSKELSNILTSRALSSVDRMVRQRSPLYQATLNAAPKEVVRQPMAEALIRALLLSRQKQDGGDPWI
ncbi:hypothetical protein ACC764_10115 [Rhizobium ruizarguesonis]|jgi:hypothetical protein|uniref:hypothetical protein n=1 Tax=Rhizobium ruizarguesonis TaxID=2081791 RepID=UPI00103126D1|nr:hypothetical protein [Rhizobium ruizarguesonis]NKJ76739.1 hypothetical protein [Rhizobium leguminosarum bv. viciae]NKQ72969.1 hypothetical protein [Rhizobium ruizarguesonis]NKQ77481.1 hypothetical protein [Rhizobium ruizarguesonis]TAZ18110.1 hypothetical protein ELH77_04605 [Rhizobium ruizarguesonis]